MTNLREQLTAEFIDMFTFVFLGAGAVVVATAFSAGGLPPILTVLGIALAQGLAMGVLISSMGHISGGHFNPAVTVGAWVAGRIETARALAYIVAQLAGAAGGAWVLSLAIPRKMWTSSSLGATFSNPLITKYFGFTKGQYLLLEAVLTFFYVFVFFATAIDERGAFKSIAGLAVGFIIAAGVLVAGPITGAGMNPGRSFGPALVSGKWTDFWIYIVGPLAGAVVAGLVYWLSFLRGPELAAEAEDAEIGETATATAAEAPGGEPEA